MRCLFLSLIFLLASSVLGATYAAVPPILLQTNGPGFSKAWFGLLANASSRLDVALHGKLRIVLLDTDSPLIHQFIWQSILKEQGQNEGESGLAGLYLSGGKIDGITEPTCYILYRPQLLASTADEIMVPLTKQFGSPDAVANYLIGHETGHCIDFAEQEAAWPQRAWTAEAMSQFGVPPSTFQRIFPGQAVVAGSLVASRSAALSDDPGEEQMRERVADIFGLFWAWQQGAPETLGQALAIQREMFTGTRAHNTAAAIKAAEPDYAKALMRRQPLALFALARQIEDSVGVDPSLVHLNSGVPKTIKSQTEKTCHWTVNVPRSIPFAELPRFGHPTTSPYLEKRSGPCPQGH